MSIQIRTLNFRGSLQKKKGSEDSKQFNEDGLSRLLLDYWYKTKQKNSSSPIQNTEKMDLIKQQKNGSLHLNGNQPDRLSIFLNEYVNTK